MKASFLILAVLIHQAVMAQPLMPDETQSLFHQLLNGERVKARRDTLSWHPDLAAAAMNHTYWMMEANRLSHSERPSKHYTGRNVFNRVEFVTRDPKILAVGENVLMAYDSGISPQELATSAIEIWMESDGHRENILNREYTHHATFFLLDAKGTLWCTDVFGVVED